MEIVIGKCDIATSVDACAVELTAGDCSFAVNVGATRGDQWVPQNFTKIDELKPSAVAHVPSWVGKVGELGLGVYMGMRGAQHALLHREAVSRNCELRGNTDGHWKKTLRRDCHILPDQISVVRQMVHRSACGWVQA